MEDGRRPWESTTPQPLSGSPAPALRSLTVLRDQELEQQPVHQGDASCLHLDVPLGGQKARCVGPRCGQAVEGQEQVLRKGSSR